ncbi:MAG: hypothetical protein A2X42_09290 [Candidatus Margulisbacteria bacterium GWF2_38_17]|nr:MAG: hypothetical protein A2X42_09290 [Candidatus Margulisbacteria bacterium GWF2_38_17]
MVKQSDNWSKKVNNIIDNIRFGTAKFRTAFEAKLKLIFVSLNKRKDVRKNLENGLLSYLPATEVTNQKIETQKNNLRIFSPKKIILFFFGVCLFTALLISTVSYYILVDTVDPVNVQTVVFKVPQNTSAQDIAIRLYDQKLIKHPIIFKVALKLLKADKNLHAGIFELTTNMNIKLIIEYITGKKGFSSITFTIPEGFSMREIADLLEKNQIVSANEFMEYASYGAVGTLAEQYEFLSNSPISSLEGYLFPDTYTVVPSLSPHQIAKMMVDRFNDKIYAYYKKNQSQSATYKEKQLTLHELLTLASIVEKEAVIDKERSLIAEVFINRLEKRMLFGADPTVKYALNEPRKKIVTFADIKIDSPYNTYKNPGLPPGPIASPGIKSFVSVLFPAKSKYLYFIAKGDGTHCFSFNEKQHNALRAKLGYDMVR